MKARATRFNAVALSLLALVFAVAPATAQRLQDAPGLETATFAGGCFWCVEADFDKIDGVVATISGYTGGTTPNPTYKQVTAGGTGHTEAVEIKFDPKKVSFEELMTYFWRTHDPLDGDGQFCDRGDSYRPAIFYHSEAQRQVAEATRDAIVASKRFKQPIATQIVAASKFTRAEEYHQDFYQKSAGRYASYRAGCGRDARIKGLWGDEAFAKKVPTQ